MAFFWKRKCSIKWKLLSIISHMSGSCSLCVSILRGLERNVGKRFLKCLVTLEFSLKSVLNINLDPILGEWFVLLTSLIIWLKNVWFWKQIDMVTTYKVTYSYLTSISRIEKNYKSSEIKNKMCLYVLIMCEMWKNQQMNIWLRW